MTNEKHLEMLRSEVHSATFKLRFSSSKSICDALIDQIIALEEDISILED